MSKILDLQSMRLDGKARAAPLHLLRPYTQWRVKEYTTKAALRYMRDHVSKSGVFGTHTTRYPVRAEEMAGGSVYWCKRGVTMFRMPLHSIEATGFGWWILMEPVVIPVSSLKVGQVRGWRYLEDERRPDDWPDVKNHLLAEIQLEDELGAEYVGIDLAAGESLNG